MSRHTFTCESAVTRVQVYHQRKVVFEREVDFFGDVLVLRQAREGLADYDLALCGHVHGAWKERVVQGKRVINVGVDVRGFRPVSLASLVGDPWVL